MGVDTRARFTMRTEVTSLVFLSGWWAVEPGADHSGYRDDRRASPTLLDHRPPAVAFLTEGRGPEPAMRDRIYLRYGDLGPYSRPERTGLWRHMSLVVPHVDDDEQGDDRVSVEQSPREDAKQDHDLPLTRVHVGTVRSAAGRTHIARCRSSSTARTRRSRRNTRSRSREADRCCCGLSPLTAKIIPVGQRAELSAYPNGRLPAPRVGTACRSRLARFLPQLVGAFRLTHYFRRRVGTEVAGPRRAGLDGHLIGVRHGCDFPKG
jgi:hypothetical protein